MRLQITGLGFVLYSGSVIPQIEEGYDFLQNEFWDKEKVAEHVIKGDMVGICTGSPGSYSLVFQEGEPTQIDMFMHPFKIGLAIEITDGKLYVKDLYDLMEWHKECPENQSITLENGFYFLKIMTDYPDSGIIGDDQEILIFYQKRDTMPEIKCHGVPNFNM